MPEDPPESSHVDLERYAGLWHEIARLPVFFQDAEDRATSPTTTLNADGTIDLDQYRDSVRTAHTRFRGTGHRRAGPGVEQREAPRHHDNFFAPAFSALPPE